MSKEGSITRANYIDYDKAYNKSLKLLNSKDAKFGLYIMTAINVGLRIGDILKLTHSDLINGEKEFREEKTEKYKKVKFNKHILDAYNKVFKDVKVNANDFIFKSQKRTVFTRQQINRKLKSAFTIKNKNISSHSLRKTFGRRVYETNNESEKALLLLNDIYNHETLKQTKKYLDITQEEINNVYDCL